jgi:hypothetical protein
MLQTVAAMDLFVTPTIGFKLLYAFIRDKPIAPASALLNG